jgi:hypothetical protein
MPRAENQHDAELEALLVKARLKPPPPEQRRSLDELTIQLVVDFANLPHEPLHRDEALAIFRQHPLMCQFDDYFDDDTRIARRTTQAQEAYHTAKRALSALADGDVPRVGDARHHVQGWDPEISFRVYTTIDRKQGFRFDIMPRFYHAPQMVWYGLALLLDSRRNLGDRMRRCSAPTPPAEGENWHQPGPPCGRFFWGRGKKRYCSEQCGDRAEKAHTYARVKQHRAPGPRP